MHIAIRRAPLMVVAMLAGCNRGPSRAEALQAIRSSGPGLDTTVVESRVWQDGPPWFSCAEVVAKLASRADSDAVRGPVGNWRSLVLAGWVVLRDSTKGPVADPGWCTLKLTDEGARRTAAWPVVPGPPFPTGEARRGWVVPVGRRRITMVGSPSRAGGDSARATFIVTVAPNENGIGTGAAADTGRYVADLVRGDAGWRLVAARPAREGAR